MSEYQRYEFMTCDRPLTKAQLDEVEDLSSHIEASATHAVIEYHWGDFKHDPIKVLHKYFDGFLYWANWGSPRFALRFPHGALPGDLIDNYDFDDFVTLTHFPDYDILDIHFGEMEAPDEWVEYDLGSLIGIREELIEGDLRALYIAWLACQPWIGDEDEDDEDEDEDEDEIISIAAVPPGFAKLTKAQQALAELLRVSEELLAAAGRHSKAAASSPANDFVAWIELLSQERRRDYLVRLARNESGLSRQLVKELRELGLGKKSTAPATGERVPYSKLLAESKAVKNELLRERLEQERLARQRHLQDIHTHQEVYWSQVTKAAARGNASGYDEATRLLVDLRDAADQFNETQAFQTRYVTWVRLQQRRPALMKRLYDRNFRAPDL